MPTVRLTPVHREHFVERIAALRADTPRRWGTLDATALLAHFRRAFEMSLGEVEIEDVSNPLSRTLVRWLAFHVMPTWPRGKIKVPDALTPAPEADFETERERCLLALDRFLAAQSAEPQRRTRHPAFGELTLDYWGHIHGRHMRHHFEQFGV